MDLPSDALDADTSVTEVDDPTVVVDTHTKQAIQFEHHIVYSTSYQVPVLYFKATHLDGTPLSPQHIDRLSQARLSQLDHPVLGTPFWYIHPCDTRIAMSTFKFKREDYIKTWLSLFGPLVQCPLSLALFA
ncbi:uncharacterized protein B0P05DRAFT_479938 [Gilbertella persicaria]|uniref:uncharacterized protein n=1 Tax=Gilbertella persicaria TaxID=101096 RepID=UPI00221E89FD|nr:uncharacterized protein B0P05DRAFT_479938 [Gilbertella persicaria]KAI8051921.1 hypothetical protein B0P05DRAFT_479938 [Gilbertella persicaria]